jgi:hypothetical protein
MDTILEEEFAMENISVPGSDWNGQLPLHIAANVPIWWLQFPRIKPILAPRLLGLFGGAKESPTRETIGKVVAVAHTRDYLREKFGTLGGSLLNVWGCYCSRMIDKEKMVYIAGTATEPHLIFTVFPFGVFAIVELKFVGSVDLELDLSDEQFEKLDQDLKDALKQSGSEKECEVTVEKFKRGSWEKGLDIAFNAAVWVRSNLDEGVPYIWHIQ